MNLAGFTGKASVEKQRGKRPYFYNEKTGPTVTPSMGIDQRVHGIAVN